MPFSHFVCLRAAHLALLSVKSRIGSVLDLLPLCLPLVGRSGRSNSPRLFLKARLWHYTVLAIGMLDMSRMRTMVFPVCHLLACMRLVAAGCQRGHLTKNKSKMNPVDDACKHNARSVIGLLRALMLSLSVKDLGRQTSC